LVLLLSITTKSTDRQLFFVLIGNSLAVFLWHFSNYCTSRFSNCLYDAGFTQGYYSIAPWLDWSTCINNILVIMIMCTFQLSLAYAIWRGASKWLSYTRRLFFRCCSISAIVSGLVVLGLAMPLRCFLMFVFRTGYHGYDIVNMFIWFLHVSIAPALFGYIFTYRRTRHIFPRCSQCSYLTLGLASNRCPECNATLIRRP